MNSSGFTPEDEAFFELLNSREYISSTECHQDHLYWGYGRAIGELAVCQGTNQYDDVEFEGLREKMGVDFLFRETHYNDAENSGTFRPFVDLGPAPDHESEEERMNWLLDQTIELVETRIEWLRNMPEHLKNTPYYSTEEDERHLESLQKTRELGFSHNPMLTFRQIMDAAKLKKESTASAAPSELKNDLESTNRRSVVNERRRRVSGAIDDQQVVIEGQQ